MNRQTDRRTENTIHRAAWSQLKTLHATHFLKLLDKMFTYKMDLVSIVEQTQFCPHMDILENVL